MSLVNKLFGRKKQDISTQPEIESKEIQKEENNVPKENDVTNSDVNNNPNQEGLEALIFITELNSLNIGLLAERANLNMSWMLEELNGWGDSDNFINDKFKNLLSDRMANVKVLKSWLLPRLRHEEETRESTYPTFIVLQVLGLLDGDVLKELVEERISIIGDSEINNNDENYDYQLQIMSETLDSVLPILFRRAFGSHSKKKRLSDNSLTDNYSLFSNDERDEFSMAWEIIKLSVLFKDSEYALPTKTIGEIINGDIQRLKGFHSYGFLKYLKNSPKEQQAELQELRKSIIKNNDDICKEIEDEYSY